MKEVVKKTSDRLEAIRAEGVHVRTHLSRPNVFSKHAHFMSVFLSAFCYFFSSCSHHELLLNQ